MKKPKKPHPHTESETMTWTIEGDLEETTLTGLNAVGDLSTLTAVGGGVYIYDIPEPTSLAFPVLATVGADVEIANMEAVASLSFSELDSIGAALRLHDMPLLASVDLSDLASVGILDFRSIPAVAGLAFPSLVSIGGGIGLAGDLSGLTTISLPAIESIGEFVSTDESGSENLSSVTLGTSLKSVGGDVTFYSCALDQASVDGILVRLAALDGTNGTTSYAGHFVILKGSAAAPGSSGLAAKSVLEGRGCTVQVN